MSRVKAFRSWYETFYEMCSHIEYLRGNNPITHSKVREIQEQEGGVGMYELCCKWTTEFEMLRKGREFDGEWIFEIEKFIKSKDNEN